MKAFASALLLAGAHATAGAIDFNVEASSALATLSSSQTFLTLYGTKTNPNVKVLNDSKVTYKVSTDHAKKQYTLEMIMVAAHEGDYAT